MVRIGDFNDRLIINICTLSEKSLHCEIFLTLSEIVCPFPPSFSSSRHSFDNIRPGGVVEYTCNAGYHLVEGTINWQCGKKGDWLGEDIVCEGKCQWILCQHCVMLSISL